MDVKKDQAHKLNDLHKTFINFCALYLLWIIPCTLIFLVPEIMERTDLLIETVVLLTTVLFIMLASVVTVRTLQFYAGEKSETQPNQATYLLIMLLIGIGNIYAQKNRMIGMVASDIVGTANMLVAATYLGYYLRKSLKKPSELVPLCVIASFADISSILMGPTKFASQQIEQFYKDGMEGPRPLVDFFLIKIPILNGQGIMPVFGVSDWIIVALLFSAVSKLGITGKAAFFTPFAGLLAAITTAHITGLFLPGIPAITLVFIPWLLLSHPGSRKLTRKEWMLTLLFPLGILLITGLLYLL